MVTLRPSFRMSYDSLSLLNLHLAPNRARLQECEGIAELNAVSSVTSINVSLRVAD